MTHMSKEMREEFEKAIEGASFETLCELKKVIAERVETIKTLGAVDDGSEEKLRIVKKMIDKKDIEARVARKIRRG